MERHYTGDIPDDEASETTADTTDESSTDNGDDESKWVRPVHDGVIFPNRLLWVIDDDDDVQDEDAEYLEFLAQQANGGASQSGEEEEEEEEIGEEILFESPLDNVDPYLTFESVFKRKCLERQLMYGTIRVITNIMWVIELQQTQPPSYTLLTSALNVDQQQQLMTILSTAGEYPSAFVY